MNIDKRGIKRGNCLAENCDCELFEYEQKMGSNCSYCSCPPTKHQKLGVSEKSMEENFDLTSSFENNCNEAKDDSMGEISVTISTCENNGIQAKDSMEGNSVSISSFENNGIQAGCTIQNVDAFIENVDSFPTSSCSPSLQNLLPLKLPETVADAMSKKALTPKLRNKVIRLIADRCYEQEISSNKVDIVAHMATQRWSPLKSRFGEPSDSLAVQIKRRISKLKLNTNKSKDSEVNAEEEETHDFNQQQMISEMEKQIPSQLKLKQFLDATRGARKSKINHTAALQILVEYPALKIPDLLLWEFTKLVEIEVDDMTLNWKSFLDKLKGYLKETQNFTPASESYEGLTLEVLMKLPSIVPSGKRTSGDTKFVLQIPKDNTAIIVPLKSDPPRLIGIGSVETGMNFFSYVDGTALFSEKCPIKALLLLLATYWVFNIQFVAEAKPALHVISCAVLKEKMPRKKGEKLSGAVNCLLKQLNL